MRLKVLVLGSTGLIGHQVFSYLIKTEKYELYNRFDNHEERIFYGIVSNASIYISSS